LQVNTHLYPFEFTYCSTAVFVGGCLQNRS